MIKRFLAWLQSIYIKPAVAETQENTQMTDTTADLTATPEETTQTEVDAVLAKLKELVTAAGAQAHVVFDDLAALAKKLS